MSDVGRDLSSPLDLERLVDDGITVALNKQERAAFFRVVKDRAASIFGAWN
jgi:hypothetical protein